MEFKKKDETIYADHNLSYASLTANKAINEKRVLYSNVIAAFCNHGLSLYEK
jgi:hypothetical protein